MTSATEKSLDGDGALASNHNATNEVGGLTSLMAMIAERALDRDGNLVGPSALLNTLRTSDGREKLLREFVIAMQPAGVNPVLWDRWLNGGPSPFDPVEKLDSPTPGTMGISRAVERQDKAVQKARATLNKASRAVETAKAKVAEAEKALQIAEAKDAAFLEYVLSEHLMGIMQPAQMMGPLWTVMRAVSSYLNPETLRNELVGVREAKHADTEVFIRSERETATREILTVLDQWSGDVTFEEELRSAIAGVTSRYVKRERAGEQRRSAEAFASSLRTMELRQERRDIIAGLSTGKP